MPKHIAVYLARNTATPQASYTWRMPGRTPERFSQTSATRTSSTPCAILNYHRAGSRISGKTSNLRSRERRQTRAFSYYQFN
jgi:hypothetical protein